MSSDSQKDALGISVAFLDVALGDIAKGGLRPLADYLAMFPGFEDVVTVEYGRLRGDDAASTFLSSRSPEQVVIAFEGAWTADRAAGRLRSLAEYVALLPGNDSGIAARFAELRADESPIDRIAAADAGASAGRIAHYSLETEIGRGGQGVVYRARDERLGREVALKVLPAVGVTPEAIERFHREAKILARLDDADICPIYEAGVDQGCPFIAMRLVEGRSLAEVIREARGGDVRYPLLEEGSKSRVPFADLAAWFERTARAIHRAHERGVVHRDLKPGNLFVANDGAPVILDFGLATIDAPEFTSLTRTGDVHGTLPYMSPEQVDGRSNLDARADIYSLGAALYESLALRRPFEAATREALVRAIERDEPTAIRQLNKAVPRDLETIILTALAKEPERRYASAAAMAEDLARYRDGRPITARPVSLAGRTWRWARRRPAVAALLVVIALAVPTLAGLGGFLIANIPAIEEKRSRDARAAVDAILLEAYDELAMGGAARAIPRFDEAVKLDPNREEALAGAVIARITIRDLDGARAIVDRSMEKETVARRMLRRAVEEIGESGSLSEPGSDVLATATDHFVAGSIAAGRAHRMKEKDPAVWRIACEHLTIAILATEEVVPFWYRELVDVARNLADPQVARLVADGLTLRWPEDARSWYWAGVAWSDIDPARCDEFMSKALERDPKMALAWAQRGESLRRRNRLEESRVAFEKARAMGVDEGPTLRSLGSVYAGLGRFKEAMEILDAALASPRPDPDAEYDRTWVLGELGRFAEAEEAGHRYIATSGGAPRAHVGLGLILARQRKFPEAIAAFEKALERDPSSADAWRRLAQAQLASGNQDGGLASYAHVVELAPKVARNHYEYAGVLGRAGDPARAVEEFGKAVELEPGLGKAWFGKGVAHADLGEHDEAAKAFKRVTELEAENAEAWCYLGRALLRDENYAAAVEALRRGDALGRKRGDAWKLPSGEWLADAIRRESEDR